MEDRQVVTAELPPYEQTPKWIPPSERSEHSEYNNELSLFLPRTVVLQRLKTTDQLGFNIRGGKENFCGIFVSKIMPGSAPEKLGLKEGDQILKVNDVHFESIGHAEAVKVLKMTLDIQLTVQYFPYGYEKTLDKTHQAPLTHIESPPQQFTNQFDHHQSYSQPSDERAHAYQPRSQYHQPPRSDTDHRYTRSTRQEDVRQPTDFHHTYVNHTMLS